MHLHHVLHRDIKLDNILINPSTLHITIIDFNLSTFFREDVKLVEPVGCINYSSPQILEAAYGRRYYAKSGWSDLWAMGVTVYGMLCGFFPFRSEQPRKLYAEHLALRTTPLTFIPSTIDSTAQNFIHRILNLNSFGHISAASLLSDPFITGAQYTHPSDVDHLIHQTLARTVMYSRVQHPGDDLLAVSPDATHPDLSVQERAVRHLLYRMVPECGKTTTGRKASDETVVSSAGEETESSEETMDAVENENCGCFGLGVDELEEDDGVDISAVIAMSSESYGVLPADPVRSVAPVSAKSRIRAAEEAVWVGKETGGVESGRRGRRGRGVKVVA